MNLQNPLLQAALYFAELGYRVFPCRPGAKTPLTEHGVLDASGDLPTIERWWNIWPNANIGLATDGLVVVDVDGSENPWLKDAPEKFLDLGCAPLSLTANGGRQFFFRQPAGKGYRNTAGRLGPCIDTRANGGYVVAPPSVLDGGRTYRWEQTRALETPLAELPLPPAWLIASLDTAGAPAPVSVAANNANAIPQGQRNGTLTRLAGTMRRVGMSKHEILAALIQANTDRCVPPLTPQEVERVARSVARYEPDQIATAVAEGHFEQMIQSDLKPDGPLPLSVRQLLKDYPELRAPVIEGILREGETMNVISAPKIGKSWLVTDLALAVATSRPWLGYPTVGGDVLIIDNELHPHTSAHRIPKVAQARGIPLAEVAEKINVLNMRGQLRDLYRLKSFFESLPRNRYRVIVLDAFYRFMPMGMDENDNGTMANLYNYIDGYADRLNSCFVLVHHMSKGNQSGKAVTDVGAGAGSQSRCVDAHLILRPHEEENAVVLEAAVRSWAPLAARCLRWAFPVFSQAEDLDPKQLKVERPKKKRAEEDTKPSFDVVRFVETFISNEPKSLHAITREATAAGLSGRATQRFLREAEHQGVIHRWYFGSNIPNGYALIPQAREVQS